MNARPPAGEPALLLPLSARTPQALAEMARRFREHLEGIGDAPEPLGDLCYTAGARRTHFEHRLAAVGRSAGELAERLEAFARGETRPGLHSGRAPAGARGVVFVFAGQGSQWAGMGRALLDEAPFREAIEECDAALRAYVDWSVVEEVAAGPEASRLDAIDVVQPALFAVQVALAALWRAWGVRPDAVVGHSMGEVAAAHVAGALTLDDAARIVCRRSALLRRLSGSGRMASVELPLAEARLALSGYEDRVSVAASNSAASTVIAGEPGAVDEVLEALLRRGVFCRPVRVDVASHSPQVDALRDDLLGALRGVRARRAGIPLYSTVTGEPCDGTGLDAGYWVRNLRSPVLFAPAVRRALGDGHAVFVEVGPHPILLPAVRQELHSLGADGHVVASMLRGEDARAGMLAGLGALHVLGRGVAWRGVYPRGGRCVRLPGYAWQRERYWLDAPAAARGGAAPCSSAHPLLGRPTELAHQPGTRVWEVDLDARAHPPLGAHRVGGEPLLAASVVVELALAAAREAFGAPPPALVDLELLRPLYLGATPRAAQVVVTRAPDGSGTFGLYARAETDGPGPAGWTLHATATLPAGVCVPLPEEPAGSMEALLARCPAVEPADEHYGRMAGRYVEYGDALRALLSLRRGGAGCGEAMAEVRPGAALMEACVQAAAAAPADGAGGSGEVWVLAGIAAVRVHVPAGAAAWCHAVARAGPDGGDGGFEADARLLDGHGHPLVEMAGVRFRPVPADAFRAAGSDMDGWTYEVAWQTRPDAPDAPDGSDPPPGARWLVLADRGGVGEALAARMRASGPCDLVVADGDGAAGAARRAVAGLCTGPPVHGIVHLWSLDAPPTGALTRGSLRRAQALGCGSVLRLVRELARTGAALPGGMWLATRGAQPVGGGPIAVAQAPLWGLGRTVREEHREIWGGLVDLDPRGSAEECAARLWSEIRAPRGGDEVAFLGGLRHVARLRRWREPLPRPAAPELRGDGAYLITGGLGGLGLRVAGWMVERGARWLILVGRRALPPRAAWDDPSLGPEERSTIAGVRALETAGARVDTLAADVADADAVRAFLRAHHAGGGAPIRGVVHAAGVANDTALARTRARSLASVMRPKVLGAWTLHRLLRAEPLDFFVLFSSAASVFGQAGQGGYAAANAFLDAFAHWRRACGRPALSVAWGAWSGVGLAATEGGRRLTSRMERLGIGSIEPARGLDVLGRLMRHDVPAPLVLPADRAALRRAGAALGDSPLLADLLAPGGASPHGGGDPDGDGPERIDLAAADPAARRLTVERHVRRHAALALGISPARLDAGRSFSGLGLDSLMAVEVRNALERTLGVVVPTVDFLRAESVEAFVDLLTGRLGVAPDAPAGNGAAPPPAGAITPRRAAELLSEIDGLPDAEVERLLREVTAGGGGPE